jgi:uncharacterized protein (TIGR03083 family)
MITATLRRRRAAAAAATQNHTIVRLRVLREVWLVRDRGQPAWPPAPARDAAPTAASAEEQDGEAPARIPEGGRLSSVLEAFRVEAQALSAALGGLPAGEWELPTRCTPWTVRELVGHVRVTVAWLPGMLAGPAPKKAEVSAAEYYRPDDRFDATTNQRRINLARTYASEQVSGKALTADLTATWQRAYELCRAERPERVVRTRHGDAMLLSQFLITRVVEVAVHGLDIADAPRREPWLTTPAADVVMELLGPGRAQLGSAASDFAQLGWDRPTFLRKATGREPLDAAERAQLDRLGIRWLTLG